ncbi:MAG TPA: double-strand break repair protein AddB, partial [Pelagibacterium sp.]|nr:double-strand break repair protein AddB [Pelagibacterium sp.]
PPFVVSGRADRIDRTRSGGLEIIDFKTGQAPAPKEMKRFFAPQLPLEAHMARVGGFVGAEGRTENMAFIKLSHGPKALEITQYAVPDGMSLADAIDTSFTLFQNHVAAMLLRDDFPMTARVLPKPSQRFKGDYDHLARTEEWTLLDGGEEGE